MEPPGGGRGRAWCLLILSLVLTALGTGQAYGRQRLHVVVHLGSALNDGFDVCLPGNGGSVAQAAHAGGVAYEVARAMGIDLGQVVHDESYDSSCSYHSTRTLSVPGVQPHSRRFSAEIRGLADIAESEGFSGYEVVVCVPAVKVTVLTRGFDRQESDCPNQQGFRWIDPSRVGVVFQATLVTLAKGIVGTVIYWGVLLGGLALIVRWLNRRDHWGWFVRHRWVGGALIAIVVLAILFFWTFGGAYWTNFIPSLQMLLHIGVPGEIVVIAGPAVALAVTAIYFRVRGGRAYLSNHPELATQAHASSAADSDLPTPMSIEELKKPGTFEAVSSGLFFLIFVVARGPFSHRFQIYSTLGLSAIALLFMWPFAFDPFAVWAIGARRLGRMQELAIIDRLRPCKLGVDRVFVAPVPLPSIRSRGGPALRSAGAVGHRTAIVWQRAAELSPTMLCGGLLREFGVSPLSVAAAVGAMFAAIAQSDEGRAIVPWWAIVVVAAIAVISSVHDVLKRQRALRIAAARHDALEMLKGMVYFAMVTVRALPGRPGWRARLGGRARRKLYERNLKGIRRFAERAGISDARLQDAIAEMRSVSERVATSSEA